MAFQVIGRNFGYCIGWNGRNQKRNFIRIVDGQIDSTNKVEESGLFTQTECLALLVQLMGKGKRQYFIYEDQIFVYDEV